MFIWYIISITKEQAALVFKMFLIVLVEVYLYTLPRFKTVYKWLRKNKIKLRKKIIKLLNFLLNKIKYHIKQNK